MKNLMKIVATLLLLLVAVAIVMQGVTAIYDFPPTAPLAGKHLYNPYQNIDSATLRSSFRRATYTPYYEHEYNLAGFSTQCFGSQAPALWLDYVGMPLAHHQSQYLVSKLAEKLPLIGISHPSELRYGANSDIFRTLTGYDLMDVRHSGSGAWDIALSAGHYSTLGGTRVMITGQNTAQATLQALRLGHSYVIENGDEPHIQSVTVDHDTINIKLLVSADSIALIGDHGEVRHQTNNINTAQYILTPEDSYIRTQIYLPGGVTVWLNPIARTTVDGVIPAQKPVAQINLWLTTLNSIAWTVPTLFVLWLIIRLWRGKKIKNPNRRRNKHRDLYAPLQYVKIGNKK